MFVSLRKMSPHRSVLVPSLFGTLPEQGFTFIARLPVGVLTDVYGVHPHMTLPPCCVSYSIMAGVCEPVGRGVRHPMAQLVPIFAGLLLKGMVSSGGVAVCHPPLERRWF